LDLGFGQLRLERSTKPDWIDAPVSVRFAIDKQDGDLLGIALGQSGILKNVQFLEYHLNRRLPGIGRKELSNDLLDGDFGILAKMAARLADQG
jgi:hypothetical protein